jgi:hypothetical protein
MGFDYLFRQHLKNVYKILDKPSPEYLNSPIKGFLKKPEYFLPTGLMNPTIDGKVTNYFEWLSAGKFESRQSGALHQTKNFITKLFFGVDIKNLFFRIDYNPELNDNPEKELFYFNIYLKRKDLDNNIYKIKFLFTETIKYQLIYPDNTIQELNYIAKDKIIELKIPFSLINSEPGKTIQFYITLNKVVENNHYELERCPVNNYIELIQPDKDFVKHYWTI